MYNKINDVIKNTDEFMHVGRCTWDVICHDGDPIYDIVGNFQLFPLQQLCVIATNSDVLQCEDDKIIDWFQSPKDELLQHSHDKLCSYPGCFIYTLLRTWIYSTKGIFNHHCDFIFMRVRP
jgi:hypothetical protein